MVSEFRFYEMVKGFDKTKTVAFNYNNCNFNDCTMYNSMRFSLASQINGKGLGSSTETKRGNCRGLSGGEWSCIRFRMTFSFKLLTVKVIDEEVSSKNADASK